LERPVVVAVFPTPFQATGSSGQGTWLGVAGIGVIEPARHFAATAAPIEPGNSEVRVMILKVHANKGFTLTEVVIVLAVVGILVAVAVPAYQQQMRKARRSDAINSLQAIYLAQERWRANHTDYGDLADVWTGTDSSEGYYTMAVSGVSAAGYTATATRKAGESQANDTCDFTLTQAGPDVGDDAKKSCWNK
jgi:type IV pilus assembly protein PilE